MDSLVEVKLISEDISIGTFGEEVITEVSKTVWGERSAISSTEWTNAGTRGINPEFRVTIYGFEYDEQVVVEIGSAKYGVYRTYSKPNSDKIELYLQLKGGVSNEP